MIDLDRARAALADEGLCGWLLYDFRGQNPLAESAFFEAGGHRTRRWFCLVPREGAPRWLVHAIERDGFRHVPGEVEVYAERRQLADGLARLLGGARRVAMEYSPGANVPYVSKVDAGTVELVRAAGVEVASSGDLVQRLLAPWPEGGLASHARAARVLERAVRDAWAAIAQALLAGAPLTECAVQARLMDAIRAGGLETDHPPIVAVDAHAASPHFAPDPADDRPIGPERVLLIDLWAREPGAHGVYADMTHMAYTGAEPPARVETVWRTIRDARDAALDLVLARASAGAPVAGWEADRAARAVVSAAGFGDAFVHRTGHSLGPETHWIGANLDDYETHDTRRLMPDTGFTIEPGIYLEGELGMRTEIDVFWGAAGPSATTWIQRDLARITPAGVAAEPLPA